MYIGNTYGAGPALECLNYVECTGTETSFIKCGFTVDDHDDPSQDVSIQCISGMIIIASVTVRTDISIPHLQPSFADILDSCGRCCMLKLCLSDFVVDFVVDKIYARTTTPDKWSLSHNNRVRCIVG